MRYEEWRSLEPAGVDWSLLTRRQADVVALAIAGISQQQASKILGVTRQTLKDHLRAAERKLDLRLEAA